MTIGIDGNEANVQNRVGSGTYTLELLKQFQKDLSHNYIVYLKEKPQEDLPKETANFKYYVFGPKKLWTQFALSLKLSYSPKVDVFFSPAHYGPRFSKVPYVVTIHDLSYLHFPQLFRKEDLIQLTSWSKYSIGKSKHIIAPSKSTKYDIVKNYKIPTSKITITYEGYNSSNFKPQPQSKINLVKEKYKIKGDYIIFVGTLQPRKNVGFLIDAFLKIIQNSKYSDLKLVIAGKKGWLFQGIFEKWNDSKLGKNVIITDYLPKEELPPLLSGAKVYALPSLWEGFGIPVIEAQACGVPVVVSNTSSLPEIVGESGILVDPNDVDSIAKGIKKALESKNREILIKKGFANIKRFSWENCAKSTIKVLEACAI